MLCICCFYMTNVQAQEEQLDTYMEELDLQSIQESVDELLPEEKLNIREILSQLLQGKIPVTEETVRSIAENTVISEFKKQRTRIVQIFILAIAASVFSSFTGIFSEGKVQEISFYMTYLLLFTLLLDNYRELEEVSGNTMEGILQFMRLLLPVYLLASSLAARQMTAIGFYEVTLFMITLIQSLIQYLLLPGIGCYILIAMLNNVTRKEYLSRMTELVKTGIGWLLKTLLALVIGIQTIQRILFPALDQVKNSIWIRAGGAIPVVGNTLSSVTETLLGTAAVLKNAVGVTGMLILAYICIRPVLRLVICVLLYKLVSALIQPVADPRFSECVDDMADAAALLLMAVAVTGVMFFLTIAIVTTAGG